MPYSTTVWAALERWSPLAFLAAAASFVLPGVAQGYMVATGTGDAVSPGIIFVCHLVVFVGLLGLYPRLADRGSTLAAGGVGLVAVTAAMILSTFGVAVLPLGLTVGKPTVFAIVLSVAVGSMLSAATFGVASVREGVHPRPVGGFLLVVAASELFIVVAMLLYGDPTPPWVGFVVSWLVVTSLASIGYVLRNGDAPADAADSPGGVTAG